MEHVLTGEIQVDVPILVIIGPSSQPSDRANLFTVEQTATLRSVSGTGRGPSREPSVGRRLEASRGACVARRHVARDFNDAWSLHEQEIVRTLRIVEGEPRLEITDSSGHWLEPGEVQVCLVQGW